MIRSQRPGRVEAADEAPLVVGAERVLELVAVAPLLDRGDDRLELEAVELADPPQRVVDLLLLDLQLALVGQHLPRRARMVGDRRDPLRARLEDLDGARLGVVRAWTCPRPRARGRRGSRRHEHDVAVEPRDAGAAERERVDRQLELVAARRAAAGGGDEWSSPD